MCAQNAIDYIGIYEDAQRRKICRQTAPSIGVQTKRQEVVCTVYQLGNVLYSIRISTIKEYCNSTGHLRKQVFRKA